MIGTFWNLCRACPSMPVDKLHSEYRSTYRWHEYTGPRQEVVRHPPQPLAGNKEDEENKSVEKKTAVPTQGAVEPALPRRKKNPSLAYRTNEFITTKTEKDYYHTSSSLDRARCAGREAGIGSSRRSKSEGPHQPSLGSPDHRRVLRSDSDPSSQQLVISNFPIDNNCRSKGLKNAISRISTEYRLQFAWPKGSKWKEEDSNSSAPRKSLSMGAIKQQPNIAPVHKKRPLNHEGSSEMEPLVSGGGEAGEEKIQEESFSKEEKPYSSDGKLRSKKEDQQLPESWFTEVIELRRKAGQYKSRGWGTELVPGHIAELYGKQVGLWEQVSRRSSLSALSLASSAHNRSISKEEKDKENNKKSSPTKTALSSFDKTLKNEKGEEVKKEVITHRSRIDNFVRHHLERTTGAEEGILLSPTREKLEPAIPRKKDTDATTSPQKTPHSGRSQSAGSPKKSQTRSQHKTPPPEKRPRPTTLQTRIKPNTGSVKAKTKRPHREISTVDSGRKKEEPEVEVAPEPVVKSPPEPTRVKSPEQILMRSPEPVNWTVPLDTGKTFTVTQNVVHGDLQWKTQSEGKGKSESSRPPPSQSAPAENSDEKKDEEDLLVQKAQSRFDQFWGGSSTQTETQEEPSSAPQP